MVRSRLTRAALEGDGAMLALLGSLALALASAVFLLAAPPTLQWLHAISMPGVAPL